MRIKELIKDLQEVEELYGNIEVVNESDRGIFQVDTKINGEFNVYKNYVTLSGYNELGDIDTSDSELYDVDFNKPIRIVLSI